ncbi:MAG: IS1 family transposase [Rickettsiales bacterium]|nr:IS1 family transposase [Rickettsiales bacterium]
MINLKLLRLKVGEVDKNNDIDLAMRIKRSCDKINYLCTDGNKTYSYYRLAKQHVVSKSETCLVENLNSSLRDMLARLNRRTKRFSKWVDAQINLSDVLLQRNCLSYLSIMTMYITTT